MNKAYLQVWCLSERGKDVIPDGCSIHTDESSVRAYVSEIYSSRTGVAPDEYDYAEGNCFEVFIDDDIRTSLTSNGFLRLDEPSLRNLLGMQEIIIK